MLVDAVQMLKIQDEARVKNIVLNGKLVIDTVNRIRNTTNTEQLVQAGNEITQQFTQFMTLLGRR